MLGGALQTFEVVALGDFGVAETVVALAGVEKQVGVVGLEGQGEIEGLEGGLG